MSAPRREYQVSSTVPALTACRVERPEDLLQRLSRCEADPALVEFECPICIAILWWPVRTACGHVFCRQCLWQSMCSQLDQGQNEVSCPLCRSEVDVDDPNVLAIDAQLTLRIKLVLAKQEASHDTQLHCQKEGRHTLRHSSQVGSERAVTAETFPKPSPAPSDLRGKVVEVCLSGAIVSPTSFAVDRQAASSTHCAHDGLCSSRKRDGEFQRVSSAGKTSNAEKLKLDLTCRPGPLRPPDGKGPDICMESPGDILGGASRARTAISTLRTISHRRTRDRPVQATTELPSVIAERVGPSRDLLQPTSRPIPLVAPRHPNLGEGDLDAEGGPGDYAQEPDRADSNMRDSSGTTCFAQSLCSQLSSPMRSLNYCNRTQDSVISSVVPETRELTGVIERPQPVGLVLRHSSKSNKWAYPSSMRSYFCPLPPQGKPTCTTSELSTSVIAAHVGPAPLSTRSCLKDALTTKKTGAAHSRTADDGELPCQQRRGKPAMIDSIKSSDMSITPMQITSRRVPAIIPPGVHADQTVARGRIGSTANCAKDRFCLAHRPPVANVVDQASLNVQGHFSDGGTLAGIRLSSQSPRRLTRLSSAERQSVQALTDARDLNAVGPPRKRDRGEVCASDIDTSAYEADMDFLRRYRQYLEECL